MTSCRACTTWWRPRAARLNVLAARRYAGLARRLYTLVAEVTELTEKVDNALQVTEDVYLARIYAAALDLFRVPAGQRGGGPQAGDHPRHLYRAVRRGQQQPVGADGNGDHPADRGGDGAGGNTLLSRAIHQPVMPPRKQPAIMSPTKW